MKFLSSHEISFLPCKRIKQQAPTYVKFTTPSSWDFSLSLHSGGMRICPKLPRYHLVLFQINPYVTQGLTAHYLV